MCTPTNSVWSSYFSTCSLAIVSLIIITYYYWLVPTHVPLPCFHMFFLIWMILINVQWYFIMILIFISLITNESEQTFSSLLVISICSSYKMPFQAFCPCFAVIYFVESFVNICIANIFSHSGLPLVLVFYSCLNRCGNKWSGIMPLKLFSENSDKLINLCEPQFPIHKMGIMTPTQLISSFGGTNEILHM